MSSSFYIDPAQFMTTEELDRAQANLKRIAEIEAAAASEEEKAIRSTGPRTPEGKARSSRNAVKHGLSSPNPVISIEDRPAFDAMLEAYMQDWRPVGQTEIDNVRRAATAMWRYNRAIAYEAEILTLEIDYHALPSAAILDPEEAGPLTRAAFAFREAAAAGGPALALCSRYITAAGREYDRAIRQLRTLQADRNKREKEEQQQPQETAEKAELPNELPPNRPDPDNSAQKQPIPFPGPTPKSVAPPSGRTRKG